MVFTGSDTLRLSDSIVKGDIQAPLARANLVGKSLKLLYYCLSVSAFTAIRCDPIMTPKNGMVTYSMALDFGRLIFGTCTVATYSCSIGFALCGSNQTRICVGDSEGTIGIFSGNPPTCECECIYIQ